jgi:hypothetical protein
MRIIKRQGETLRMFVEKLAIIKAWRMTGHKKMRFTTAMVALKVAG